MTVFGPKTENDDRAINRVVYQKVANKTRVKLLHNEYTPEELKGIIGQFDLFISGRMHPLIHAICMSVPSIGIDYDHKIRALMNMLGQEKYVCHVKTLSFDELKLKINDAYSAKDFIADQLKPKVKIMKRKAKLNAVLVKALLKNKGII